MRRKNEIDMLHGPITGNLMRMVFPLAAISILQQLFNAADVAVVGRFADSNAIAAVGANTFIINVFLTFFTGLATGGNIAISTFIGRGEENKISRAVHSVFGLSLIGAAVLLIVGQIIAKPLLMLINTPAEILGKALLYLRIYLFALMFAVIYNFASAILRSKGDTKRPLYCLIASGVINVLLNLVLVIAFHLDVAGVAIATLISNIICAGATVLLLLREEGSFRISFSKLCLDPKTVSFTLKIGLPAGIQGMLFSISNIFIQSAINSFGADCIAGNTAAMNYEFMAYFVVNAFGQVAATYISQNYGAGDYSRCRRVFRVSLAMSLLVTVCVSSIFYFGNRFWLGLFTDSEAVLSYALIRVTFVVFLEPLTALGEIPAGGLRATGHSLLPTIISISGSCVFRIIWINTLFNCYRSIQSLMLVYPVSWVLIGIAMLAAYYITSRRTLRTV